jgi:cell division protein FtsB
MSTWLGRLGIFVAFLVVGAYALFALRGRDGVSALMEKRRQIHELQEQNAKLAGENELKRKRIQRLQTDTGEQEMEIRKQLKLQRPGETTFILPEAPKSPAQ